MFTILKKRNQVTIYTTILTQSFTYLNNVSPLTFIICNSGDIVQHSFISISIVLLHVSFDLSGYFFPGSVRLITPLVINCITQHITQISPMSLFFLSATSFLLIRSFIYRRFIYFVRSYFCVDIMMCLLTRQNFIV